MAEKGQIYRCGTCGNIVEVQEAGAGELVCCGKPMELLREKTEYEGKADSLDKQDKAVMSLSEKHVPVIEKTEKGVRVKVGSEPHPMEEEHYIELIEVLDRGQVLASYHPSPGEEPEAEFYLGSTEGITARALCNVHGLWKS